MVKTIWAVACAVIVVVGGGMLSGGCASTKSQLTDFSQTDIGEGPGATLRRLTELQKDLGGPRPTADFDQKTSAVPSSGKLASSNTTPPSSSDLVKATETKLANSRSTNPPTDTALEIPRNEHGTKPQKMEPPAASSRPNSSNADSLSNNKKSSASVASKASSQPPRATIASPKTTVSSEKEVPKSNFLSRLEDILKNRTKTSGLASPSGATTGELPVSDIKQMQDAKPAENPKPSPSPSRSVPPSENPEPPEKEVSRQTSAGQIPPAVPRPSSAAGKGTSSSDPQYRIGSEDVLHVSVWGNEQLTMDVIVRPDGKISIPLLQDVQAEGLTANELAGIIHQKLLPYIKDPNVSVIVKEINAAKVSVIGYVVRPGTFPLRGDLSVLQVLSQAGGFTPFASPRKIKLIRKTDGKTEVRVINYYDMINKGGVGDYLLKPGDTIVVP